MLAPAGAEPFPAAFHTLRPGGDAVLAIPTATCAALVEGAPAVLELIDHAPVPLREPVRSLIWLRGTVRLVPAVAQRALALAVAQSDPRPSLLDVGHGSSLLRLPLASAVITDFSGAEAIDPDTLRLSAPDPFWELESDWLRHLDRHHQDVLTCLARRLPANAAPGRVRPLTLDRYGLTLRIEAFDGDYDVRLPFPEPVRNVAALGLAVRRLAGDQYCIDWH
jgi:hypothetical protein